VNLRFGFYSIASFYLIAGLLAVMVARMPWRAQEPVAVASSQ